MNLAATVFSEWLGKLAPQASESRGGSQSLSALSLSVGVVASLALQAAYALLQIWSPEQADFSNASVAGYALASIFGPSNEWAYLGLLAAAFTLSFALAVFTASVLRDQAKRKEGAMLAYPVALALFAFNSLFLQPWIEPPQTTVHWSSAFAALVAALTCALILARLLDAFRRALPRLTFTRPGIAALGLFGGLIETGMGIILGLSWAVGVLASLLALVVAGAYALLGTPSAIALLIEAATLLLEFLGGTLLWIAGLCAAIVSVFGTLPRPQLLSVKRETDERTMNTWALWVYAAALVIFAAAAQPLAVHQWDFGLLAWLQRFLGEANATLRPVLIFLVLAGAAALAGITLVVARRALAPLVVAGVAALGSFMAKLGAAIAVAADRPGTRTKKRGGAIFATTVLLICAGGGVFIWVTREPQSLPPPPTPYTNPVSDPVSRLVFPNPMFWRINSAIEISDGHGAHMTLDQAIGDQTPNADAPICTYDIVLVVGAASSDGDREYNRRLAQCRGVSLATRIERQQGKCPGGAAGQLWIVNLGPRQVARASATDRIVLILGTDRLQGPITQERLDEFVQRHAQQIDQELGGDRSIASYSPPQFEAYSQDLSCQVLRPTTPTTPTAAMP